MVDVSLVSRKMNGVGLPSRRNRSSGIHTMSTADTPDRDLLFGLLALQMELVSQEQLTGAMQEAEGTPQRGPLPDTLVRRGVLDEADRAAVERVVSRRI